MKKRYFIFVTIPPCDEEVINEKADKAIQTLTNLSAGKCAMANCCPQIDDIDTNSTTVAFYVVTEGIGVEAIATQVSSIFEGAEISHRQFTSDADPTDLELLRLKLWLIAELRLKAKANLALCK